MVSRRAPGGGDGGGDNGRLLRVSAIISFTLPFIDKLSLSDLTGSLTFSLIDSELD